MTRLSFLQLAIGLNCRADSPSLDAALDLQAASNRLVVVEVNPASLDVSSDLQAASQCLVVVEYAAGFDLSSGLQSTRRCLIVVEVNPAGFDVRFDFHICTYSYWLLLLNKARRRHILGFEAEVAAHQVRRERAPEFIIAGKYSVGRKKAGREPGFLVCGFSLSKSTHSTGGDLLIPCQCVGCGVYPIISLENPTSYGRHTYR
jgi:hypothetical protein